jgi:protein archease
VPDSAPFEILEHPADVGFLARGASLEELFQNAALALLAIACSPENVQENERRAVFARATDLEGLLYAWLAEILAIADAEQLVFRRVAVARIQPPGAAPAVSGEVAGTAFGEKFDRARHAAGTYVKAVTWHQLRIENSAQGWTARVFLDV